MIKHGGKGLSRDVDHGRFGRYAGWAALAGGAAAWWLGRRLTRRSRSLRNQVVMITGASRGLGLCLAREFARAGCKLVICARDMDELDRATADLRARGADVLAQRCDVADRDQVEVLVHAAMTRFGGVDIVVNNAAVIQVGPFESIALQDFGRAMGVNFWGPLYLIWSVVPHMRARGSGQIVNITSIGGKVAVPHLLPYDAAKAALVSLSEGLTAELAKDGIDVTTVVPGLMRTGSPVNAPFKGNAEREYEWFSIADSSHLTSMSAERAARRILMAVRCREREVTLGWQAKTLRMLHDVFPNLVVGLSALANRLLPSPVRGHRHESTRGRDVSPSRLTAALTGGMKDAAERLNQNGAARRG